MGPIRCCASAPYASFWLRGQETERTTRGNVAVAEELAGSDDLDEIFRLDASETVPDDDEEDDEEDDEDEGEGIQPDEMPQG